MKENPHNRVANRIQNTLEESYTVIKWDVFQGCKDSPIYADQPMQYTMLIN